MGKVYVVCRGRELGLFDTWADCEEQVEYYRGAIFRGFKTIYEAISFIKVEMPAGEEYVINVKGQTKYYPDYHLFIDALYEFV